MAKKGHQIFGYEWSAPRRENPGYACVVFIVIVFIVLIVAVVAITLFAVLIIIIVIIIIIIILLILVISIIINFIPPSSSDELNTFTDAYILSACMSFFLHDMIMVSL